jgi:nitroreductase
MPDALELLTTRRSFKAVELAGPAPSATEIDTLLTVASRVPDHGKLAPWRFIVFEGEARRSAGAAIAAAFRAKYPDAKPEHVEAERERLVRAPLVIAVVSRAGPHVKIPEWEQVLSAGAAAMSLVLAAHALGYGANWITEWYAYDRGVLDEPSAWRRMSASPALFTSAGRRVRPRIGRGRRSMRSQSALPLSDGPSSAIPELQLPQCNYEPIHAGVSPVLRERQQPGPRRISARQLRGSRLYRPGRYHSRPAPP